MIHESFWSKHELVLFCNNNDPNRTSTSVKEFVTCPKCKATRAELEQAVDKAYSQYMTDKTKGV